jgi:hypothetical protein
MSKSSRISFIALLSFVFLLVPAFYAVAEDVQSSERLFAIKYKDGTLERYKVRWVAYANMDVREDGHPAVPLKGWITDTRQCFWTITSHIDRRVYLLNKLGQEFSAQDLFRTYNTDFTNKGSDFVVLKFRSENCGDCAARRDSDFNNAKTNLRSVYDNAVKIDLDKLKADAKANAEVVSVDF